MKKLLLLITLTFSFGFIEAQVGGGNDLKIVNVSNPPRALATNPSEVFDDNVIKYMAASNNVSNVSMTLNIKTSDVVKLIRDGIKNPIANGETPELGFMLFADEPITKTKIVQTLVTPAKDAYTAVQKIGETVIDHVKVGVESYLCLITPWNWGHCFKDIWQDVPRTVYHDVTVTIPAVAAVYVDTVVPYIEIEQALVPIKGQFAYECSLVDLNARFNNNTYNVDGVIEITVRTNVDLELAGVQITPRGTVDSKFQVTIHNNGFIEFNDDGTIKATSKNSSFEVTQALGGDFAIRAIDFGTHQNLVEAVILDLIGDKLNNILNEKIQGALSTQADKINIKKQAQSLVSEFDKPLKVNDNGFLYPNVTAIFLSQPNGHDLNNENQIEVKVGVAFQPFATFEETPHAIPDKTTVIKFGTEINSLEGFNISAPIFLNYDFISDQIKPLVTDANKAIAKTYFVKRFIISNPSANYLDKEEVKWQVYIEKRKNNKQIGRVYLNAAFKANQKDNTICVKVSKVGVKTSNLWIWLGKRYIKKKIKEEAESHSCQNFSKQVENAKQDVDGKLTIVTPLGMIKGKAQSLALTDILAYPNFMILKASITGSLHQQ